MRYDGKNKQEESAYRMFFTQIPTQSLLQSKTDNSNMVMVPVAEVDSEVEGARQKRSVGPINPSLTMVYYLMVLMQCTVI